MLSCRLVITMQMQVQMQVQMRLQMQLQLYMQLQCNHCGANQEPHLQNLYINIYLRGRHQFQQNCLLQAVFDDG